MSTLGQSPTLKKEKEFGNKGNTLKQLKLHAEPCELTLIQNGISITCKGSFSISNRSRLKRYDDVYFIIELYDRDKSLIDINSFACVEYGASQLVKSISLAPQKTEKIKFNMRYSLNSPKKRLNISNAKYYSFSIDKYDYKEESAGFSDLLNANKVLIFITVSVIGCCAALISFLVYKFKNKSGQQEVRAFAEASDEYTDDMQPSM